ILSLYRTVEARPLGRWLFSRLVCWKAPYFSSIGPRIVSVAPGRGEATLRHRRRVSTHLGTVHPIALSNPAEIIGWRAAGGRRLSNHLGTVHAIALCNLAEFIGGLTTEVSIPPSMRWIPRGMSVEYLKKARGTMRAVATPTEAAGEAGKGHEWPVRVEVFDAAGEMVFRATIRMWLSPRRT